MENHFEMGLDALRQKILLMASRAETAVNQSVQALVQRDYDLAVRVREDDNIIDQFEVEIDEMAIVLLTKAPLASNLRLITVAMKVSQNLERIGDEATKIAKRARDLAQEPPVKINFDVNRMASMSLAMVKDALDAFVQRDSAAARALIPRDNEVDALNKEIHQQLAQHMTDNPETIGRCLHWIVAAKSLERIDDHAKNIAEEVVFLCEAQDIRHTLKNWGRPACIARSNPDAATRGQGCPRSMFKTDFACAAEFFWQHFARMFSIQQLFSKGDRFQELLEAAAQESHESVRLVIELMKSPRNTQNLDDLILARRKEKKISEQISNELVKTFITGLEREDIEALARGLYRIPKAAEKLAERLVMAGHHLDGIDFSKQADMMAKATDAINEMVKQLRSMEDMEKMKTFNDRLQLVEVEADKYMNELLRDLYGGKYDAIRAIVVRDVYELMEK